MERSKTIAIIFLVIFLITSVLYLLEQFEKFGRNEGACAGSSCKVIEVGNLFNISLACEKDSDYEWTIQSANFTMLMFYRKGVVNKTSSMSEILGTEYSECFFEFRAMKLGSTRIKFSYCIPDNCESTTIKKEEFQILMF
ncbi:MAG: hypothetical protein D6707_04915 [Bacteroidetes bacterium]|nr:MAG: hypothetical protein D6707_04915 [Bacteroidota bacterium]